MFSFFKKKPAAPLVSEEELANMTDEEFRERFGSGGAEAHEKRIWPDGPPGLRSHASVRLKEIWPDGPPGLRNRVK